MNDRYKTEEEILQEQADRRAHELDVLRTAKGSSIARVTVRHDIQIDRSGGWAWPTALVAIVAMVLVTAGVVLELLIDRGVLG